MIDEAKAARSIESVVGHLVQADYAAVERLTKCQRLSAAEIERAIAGYGRHLVVPPPNSGQRSVVEIAESNPSRWSVYVDLWTLEEGQSDLTLELTLIDSGNDTYDVEIDNIHAL